MGDYSESMSTRNYPRFNGENFQVWYGAMQGTMPSCLRYLAVTAESIQANPSWKLPNITELQYYLESAAGRKMFSESELKNIASTVYSARQNFLSADELVSTAAASNIHATDGTWTPNQQAPRVKTSPATSGSPEASRWMNENFTGIMKALFAAEDDNSTNAWWRMKLPLCDKSSIIALVTFYSNPAATNLRNDASAYLHLTKCLDMQNPEIQCFITAANSSRSDFEGADYLHLLCNLLDQYSPLTYQAVKDAEDSFSSQILNWDAYGGDFRAFSQDVRAKRNDLSNMRRRAQFIGLPETQSGSIDQTFATLIAAALGSTGSQVPNFSQWQQLGIDLQQKISLAPHEAAKLVEGTIKRALELAGTSSSQHFVKSSFGVAGGRGGGFASGATSTTLVRRNGNQTTSRLGNTMTSMMAAQPVTRADTVTSGGPMNPDFETFRQLQQLRASAPIVSPVDSMFSGDQFQALVAALTETIGAQVKQTLKAGAVQQDTKKFQPGSGQRQSQRPDAVTQYRLKQEANQRSAQVHANISTSDVSADVSDIKECQFCASCPFSANVRAKAGTHTDEACERRRKHTLRGAARRAQGADRESATSTSQRSAVTIPDGAPPRNSAPVEPRRRDGALMAHASVSPMSGQFEEVSSDEEMFGTNEYAGVAVAVGELDTAGILQENRVNNLPGEDKWTEMLNLTADDAADLLRDLSSSTQLATGYMHDLVTARVKACSLAQTEDLVDIISKKALASYSLQELAFAIRNKVSFRAAMACLDNTAMLGEMHARLLRDIDASESGMHLVHQANRIDPVGNVSTNEVFKSNCDQDNLTLDLEPLHRELCTDNVKSVDATVQEPLALESEAITCAQSLMSAEEAARVENLGCYIQSDEEQSQDCKSHDSGPSPDEEISISVGNHNRESGAFAIRFIPCSDQSSLKTFDFLSTKSSDKLRFVVNAIAVATGVQETQVFLHCHRLPGIEHQIHLDDTIRQVSRVCMRLFTNSEHRLFLDVSAETSRLGTLHVDPLVRDVRSSLQVALTRSPFYELLPRYNLQYALNPYLRVQPGPSAAWNVYYHAFDSTVSAIFDLDRAGSTVRDVKEWLTECVGWSQYTTPFNQAYFLNGHFLPDSTPLQLLPFQTGSPVGSPSGRTAVPLQIEVCTNHALNEGNRVWLGSLYMVVLAYTHDVAQTCELRKRPRLSDSWMGTFPSASAFITARQAAGEARREAAQAYIKNVCYEEARRRKTAVSAPKSPGRQVPIKERVGNEVARIQRFEAEYQMDTGHSHESRLRRVELLQAQASSQSKVNSLHSQYLQQIATQAWDGRDDPRSWEARRLQLFIRTPASVETLVLLTTASTLHDLHVSVFGQSAVSLLDHGSRLVYNGKTVPNCDNTFLDAILLPGATSTDGPHSYDCQFFVETQLRRGMPTNQSVDEQSVSLLQSTLGLESLPSDAAYLQLLYASAEFNHDFLVDNEQRAAQIMLNGLLAVRSTVSLDPMDYYPKTGVHVLVKANGFCLWSSLDFLGYSVKGLKHDIVQLLVDDPTRLITPFHTIRDLLLDGYGLDVRIPEQRKKLVFRLRLLTFDPADEILPSSGWPNDSVVLIVAHIIQRTILLYSYKIDNPGLACLSAVYPCWFGSLSKDKLSAPVSLVFGATPGDKPLCIDKFGHLKDPYMYENTHFDPLITGVKSEEDPIGRPVLTLEYPSFVRPQQAVILLDAPRPETTPVLLEVVDNHSDDSEDSILALTFPSLQADTRVADPVLLALPPPSDGVSIPAFSPPPDSVVVVNSPSVLDAQLEEEIRSRFGSVGNSTSAIRLLLSVYDSLDRDFADSQRNNRQLTERVTQLTAANSQLRRTVIDTIQLVSSDIGLASEIVNHLYDDCAAALVCTGILTALRNTERCSTFVEVSQLNKQVKALLTGCDILRIENARSKQHQCLPDEYVASLLNLREKETHAHQQKTDFLVNEITRLQCLLEESYVQNDDIDQLRCDHDTLLAQVGSLQTLRDRDAAQSRQREQQLLRECEKLTSLLPDLEKTTDALQNISCEVQHGLHALRNRDAACSAAVQALLSQQLTAVQSELAMSRERERSLIQALKGVRAQNAKLTACLNGDPFPNKSSLHAPPEFEARMPTLKSLQVQLLGIRSVVDDIRGVLPPAVLRAIQQAEVQTDDAVLSDPSALNRSKQFHTQRASRSQPGPKPVSKKSMGVKPPSDTRIGNMVSHSDSRPLDDSPVAYRTRSGNARRYASLGSGYISFSAGTSPEHCFTLDLRLILTFPALRLHRLLYLRQFEFDADLLIKERVLWNEFAVADFRQVIFHATLNSPTPLNHSSIERIVSESYHELNAELHRDWILRKTAFSAFRQYLRMANAQKQKVNTTVFPYLPDSFPSFVADLVSSPSSYTLTGATEQLQAASDSLYSAVSPQVDSALGRLQHLTPTVNSLGSLLNSSLTSLFNSVSPVKPSQRERESGVDAQDTHLNSELASRLQEESVRPKTDDTVGAQENSDMSGIMACKFCAACPFSPSVRAQAGTHTDDTCDRRRKYCQRSGRSDFFKKNLN